MQITRKALLAALLTVPVALTLTPGAAHAHGTMNNPPSRAMVCYLEGPESPRSAACKQAVALGGTQPLYDWNEVNLANAAGRHRELIPDGRLCSAGRDKYRGLDQARADWPAAALPSGGRFTFTFRGTAPHRGSFELYLTKPGYDPAKPLKWSDLEAKPFHRQQDPSMANGSYVMEATLPVRTGRHLIYAIWQRSDSPEAFYSCSDVVFGSGGTSPTPAPTASPTSPTPSASPTSPAPTPTPTATAPPVALSHVDAGAGVRPVTVRAGGQVTVTAVCGTGRVRAVTSAAFTPRRHEAAAPAAVWTPALTAARPGRHAVVVSCQDGGTARTFLTVTR
ncbi:lytic polysaccharide monooxygenase auxiliary activity family 9 protein [Thermoactinospora rubra]|uniref:lytic polysaccharide monooxygenase auxiliary activity family 9 protein n=1 Tax=Thermoactinospora rubra TaxID=1088767 RepID=UPI000A10BCD7|nr:lytic polysaccharide monooxygenase [Thermoactinospora rubra]